MSIVKSLSVGEGDMYYIKHGSDNFTVIDCCIDETNRTRIMTEIIEESDNKGIRRLISTHPDDDHIRGLTYFNNAQEILNFYCIKNNTIKAIPTQDFNTYCELRDSDKKAYYLSEGCKRKWMNLNSDESDNEQRGNSGINILWPKLSNEKFKEALRVANTGGSPNNISPIIQYSLNDSATILWFGDLTSEFMENISNDLNISKADIIFAPHHGRDSGRIPYTILENIDPKIIIIGEAPAKDLNYYNGYHTLTQNTAGDIVLDCVEGKVDIYVSSNNYKVSYLRNRYLGSRYGLNYLGTLEL